MSFGEQKATDFSHQQREPVGAGVSAGERMMEVMNFVDIWEGDMLLPCEGFVLQEADLFSELALFPHLDTGPVEEAGLRIGAQSQLFRLRQLRRQGAGAAPPKRREGHTSNCLRCRAGQDQERPSTCQALRSSALRKCRMSCVLSPAPRHTGR